MVLGLCNDVRVFYKLNDLDTSIEFCEAKDHSLTVLITGKRGKVEEARARLVRGLQTQVTREISVPKEHHRVLIGTVLAKIFRQCVIAT